MTPNLATAIPLLETPRTALMRAMALIGPLQPLAVKHMAQIAAAIPGITITILAITTTAMAQPALVKATCVHAINIYLLISC